MLKFVQYKKEIERLTEELKAEKDSLKRLSEIINEPMDTYTNTYRCVTGLGYLRHEIQFGLQKESAVSIALFDIDALKVVNDICGLTYGDECLIRIAKTITESVSIDKAMVARFSGEEFLVIFPNAEMVQVYNECLSIQKKIEDLKMSYGKERACSGYLSSSNLEKLSNSNFITVSVSVLSRIPCITDTYEGYLAECKELLAVAKQKGYNSIEINK